MHRKQGCHLNKKDNLVKQRSFFRDISSILSSNAATALFRFFIGVMLARLLGPHDRGVYASLMVVPMMVMSIVEMGIRRSSIHHIGSGIYTADKVVSVLLIIYIVSSVTGIAISAVVYYFMRDQAVGLPLVILSLLTIPVSLIFRFARGIFLGKQQIRRNNLMNWLPVFLNMIILPFFIWIFHFGLAGALSALLISNIMVAVFTIKILSAEYKIRFSFDRKIFNSLIGLGLMYALAMFVIRLNYRIDVIILQKLADFREVGYYSLGVAIAENWQAPFTMGALIMSRSANTTDQQSLDRQVAKLFRITLLIGIFAAALVYFLCPYLVPLIYGKRYIPSISVIQTILPGVLFLFIVKILGSRLAGLKKTYYVILVFVPALIINIIFNFILIPKFGGTGAAMASNISYSFGTISLLLIYCRLVKMPIMQLFAYKKSDFDFVRELKTMLPGKLKNLFKKN